MVVVSRIGKRGEAIENRGRIFGTRMKFVLVLLSWKPSVTGGSILTGDRTTSMVFHASHSA